MQQDFAASVALAAVVAQPQVPHSQVSQLQTPVQFGHWQSTQPQDAALAEATLPSANPNTPAQAKVAAARTAGMENVLMIFSLIENGRKTKLNRNVIPDQLISAICKEERAMKTR